MLFSMRTTCFSRALKTVAALFGIVVWSVSIAGHAAEPPLLKSVKSGAWSDAATWDAGRIPQAGDRVLIRQGHQVQYDVDSKEIIRMVQIAGTLDFARDRNTRLEVGLIKITANKDLAEDGFDCHDTLEPPAAGKPRPALLVGTPDEPIHAGHTARIRLNYIADMNQETCPAIICCGGQMDFHGSPMTHTWVKLQRTASPGATMLQLADAVDGWQDDDQIIVTATFKPSFNRLLANQTVQTEQRRIAGIVKRGFRGWEIRLDQPLQFEHYAEDNYRAEVADLTRNVIVESADPDGVRGHTMYHANSTGSISYAEFRHLGKRDVLGKYPIHFHLVGESMRGSSVIGASIWDSQNRWITIHGSNDIVVRDCVGYKSIGHGFFQEDGTEVYNVLDHNLAVQALAGKPLPKQAMSFDENRGAGFWWANSLNTFTNNVAVECDEYGYRFEVKKTDDFDPVLPIMQPDGTMKLEDIRTLPFVKFENNEAHAQRSFGLNLRGLTLAKPGSGQPLDFYAANDTLVKEGNAAQPDWRYPFWIHNFRVWDCNWSFHSGTSGVFLDGLDVFRSEYGIWRSVLDRNTWRNTSFKEIANKDLHMPFSLGLPEPGSEIEKTYYRGIPRFQDDAPPTTVITHVLRISDEIVVRGTTSDSSGIKSVTVNGRLARPLHGDLTQWEISFAVPPAGNEAAPHVVAASTASASASSMSTAATSPPTNAPPLAKPFTVTAYAEDEFGHVEPRPHVVTLGATGVSMVPANTTAMDMERGPLCSGSMVNAAAASVTTAPPTASSRP